MDRLVGLLVRIVAFLSGFADKRSPRARAGAGAAPAAGAGAGASPATAAAPAAAPGASPATAAAPVDPLRVLLVGYNGARNTGADVRVASLIDQINDALFAQPVPPQITLMTLDAESTAVYTEGKAAQVQFSSIFFLPTLQQVSAHDVIVLCEGSMLKSKFANSLTLFMCLAAGIAKRQGKPCIAYGVEVGHMDPFVERIAADLCSDVRFIPRTQNSLDALRRLGLDGVLGTDTAWPFASESASDQARDELMRQGWDGTAPLLGVAAINPFCWPVRPSVAKGLGVLTGGDRTWHYQKWYFFSWSDDRARKQDAYIRAMADAVTRECDRIGAFPVIIGMEKLDARPCQTVQGLLPGKSAIILSGQHDGYLIDQVIARLSALVTSRYHASLLAMKSDVPAVAVSMDERLSSLFQEAQLPAELLLDVEDPQLSDHILRGLRTIQDRRADVARLIADERARSLEGCALMQRLFAQYVGQRSSRPAPPPPESEPAVEPEPESAPEPEPAAESEPAAPPVSPTAPRPPAKETP